MRAALVALALAAGCHDYSALDWQFGADAAVAGGDLGSALDLATNADGSSPGPLDFASPGDDLPMLGNDLASTSDGPVVCPSVSADATHFVDPTFGADDPAHGGGPGACAYATIDYALAAATGPISLAKATYSSPKSTFKLVADQQLLCNGATLRNPGDATWHSVVVLYGGANALSDCALDGEGVAQDCVAAYGNTAGPSQKIANCTMTGCTDDGVYVAGGGLDVSGCSISNTVDGLLWYGAPGTMTNNRFANVTRDIDCPNMTYPNLTGSGNSDGVGKATCVGCANCPF
jgi:hypothetical protein